MVNTSRDRPDLSPGPLFGVVLASIAITGPLAVNLFFPVIPAVKAALNLSDALAQLAFSVSMFTMAFSMLACGSLADRYGRRPVLLTGLASFLVGSLVCAAAETLSMLVLGRVIQAVGAGCGITLVRTIARDAYGPDRLVKVLAYLTMLYAIGPMISPLVGGVLVDTLGWRSVFAFAFLFGATITLGVYLVVQETRPSQEASSGRGLFRSYAQLFAHPLFMALVLQPAFGTACYIVVSTASSTLMTETLHRPATEFGLYFVFLPIGYLLGNFIASRVGNRASVETMVLIGSAVLLVAVIVQSVLLLSGYVTPWTLLVPGCFFTLAQGIGLAYAVAGAMAVFPNLAGTAAGISVFVQNLCGALFAQLYGLLADGTPIPMIVTLSVGASLCLVAGVIPLVLSRRSGSR